MMKKIPIQVFNVLLQVVYFATILLFPVAVVKSIFLIPIITVILVGFAGGFKHGVIATLAGALTASVALLFGLIVPDSDFFARAISYLIIAGFLNFSQYLKDRYRESEMEIARMVEDSDDAIISRSMDSVITSWNKGAEHIFGYTSNEAVGKKIFIIFPDDKYSEEKFIVDTIKIGGKLEHYETIRKRKDGKLINISLTNSPIRDLDGKIVGISKIARDVTERKALESELRSSEDRYKDFIKNSSEGIWRFELSEPCSVDMTTEEQIDYIMKFGYFAECNDAMAKMYGYNSHVDLVGKPLSMLLSKVLTSKMYLSIFIRKGYQLQNIESTEKNKKGETVFFLNSLTGIIEDGCLKRGWGIQRDITASKRYADEREKLLRQVTAAKLVAEIANQEKDRFLANLSHELRTPLVSVLGYSALLKEETDPIKIQKGLNIINKNAELQLSLIEDLLDISRIISGKINLKKEDFNVSEVISLVVDSQRPRAEMRGLTIEYTPVNLTVYADRRRFAQIASNLLSNAIKFTDKGHIDIFYGLKENGNFFFKVHDTGKGIDKKDFPKLFKQFSQLSGETSTSYKAGLGLGLSIVKSLAELHKGEVSVESEVGVGSTFSVEFPVKRGEDESDMTPSLDGLNILLAEDEDDIGQLLKSTLERKGARVTLTTRAKAALQASTESKYDLYMFDLAMPEEDGISLIKKIRARGDKTPAVAVSAYVNYEDVALDSGFNLFLPKPLDINNIHQVKILLQKPIEQK